MKSHASYTIPHHARSMVNPQYQQSCPAQGSSRAVVCSNLSRGQIWGTCLPARVFMHDVEDDREGTAECVKPWSRRGKAVKRWHIDHHISCSFPSSPLSFQKSVSRGLGTRLPLDHAAHHPSSIRAGIYGPGPKATSCGSSYPRYLLHKLAGRS